MEAEVSTAHAQTEAVRRILAKSAFRTDEQRKRVLIAAVEAVYRNYCSNSVVELDAAVIDFMGVPVERDDD